jgi:hypothetical protein
LELISFVAGVDITSREAQALEFASQTTKDSVKAATPAR